MKRLFTQLVALATLVFIASTGALAQSTANYTFSTNTSGSLALDANGNAVDLTTGATTLFDRTSNAGVVYNQVCPVQQLPFTFSGMSAAYNQFSVNTNGALGLGSTIMGTLGTSNTGSSTRIFIAPFGGDQGLPSAIGSASYIRYKVVGTAPNRCLVVEWNGMKLINTGYATATTGDATYQARMYETSGVIEFVYGAMNISTAFTTGPIIGFSAGTTAGTIATVTSSTNSVSAATPTVFVNNTYTTGAITNLNSSANGSRRVYSFTPPATTPADPTTLTFNAVGPNATTVNWIDNSTTENAFIVTRATDASFTQNVVVTRVATGSVATVGTAYTSPQSGLSAGTTYYYKVQAISDALMGTGISGNQATSTAQTYYWIGAASGNSWGTGANWNTTPTGTGTGRGTALTSDILIVGGFNGGTSGGTVSISVNTTNPSIGQLQVINNTQLTLTSDVFGTTRAITLNGAPGDELLIASGSSLTLNGPGTTGNPGPVSIAFSGVGNTATINGTLNIGGSASNIVSTGTLPLNTVMTVGSTGIVNIDQNGSTTTRINNGGGTGNIGTLIFSNNSTLNLNNIGTVAPSPPYATWGASSNWNINGVTTNTSNTLNGSQSFGNVTYTSGSASAAMNIFATFNPTIQGNLTIANAGAGIFRLNSSGTVNINGNVVVTAGTSGTGALQGPSSTGTVNILGNLTINGGSFAPGTNTSGAGGVNVYGNTTIGAAGTFYVAPSGSTTTVFNQRGSTFTNNGTLNGSATNGGAINFNSSTNAAQTFAGSGSVTGSIAQIGVQTSGGLNITHTNQIVTQRINLLNGAVTGAGKLTIGSGGTNASTVQYGGVNATTAAGSLDAAPTFNLGTGVYTIIDSVQSNARTTGFEIPSSPRTVSAIRLSNANGLTVSGGNLSTGALNFLTGAGTIITSSSNLLTVTGTATTAITGASATSYVKGPLAITLPLSLATGSTYTLPVGKSGYNPLALVNPTTNSGGTVTVQAEVFDANSGGSVSGLLNSLNTNRYWAASITSGSGNFTNTLIQLNDTRGAADAVASSSTVNGTYAIVGGNNPTLTSTSITSVAPAATGIGNFYVMAARQAATYSNLTITPSTTQCTNVSRPVSVTVTPGTAAITGVVLSYQVNGGAVNNVSMTNTTNNGGLLADTWTGTIPAVTPSNGTVTWTVNATDGNSLTSSVTGTSYKDEPANGISFTASANRTSVCINDTTAVKLNLSSTAAYCVTTAANSGNTYNINNFSTTGGILNVSNLGSGLSGTGYGDFTSTQTVQQAIGGTVNISGAASGTFTFGWSVWVDWNWNGTFETTERVYTSGAYVNSTTGSFVVPGTAKYGATRMRVLIHYLNTSPTDPCTITSNGEAEDYTFFVGPQQPTAYSWSNGASTVGSTNPYVATITANTTYTGTATISACPVSASVAITSLSLPTAPTANNSTHCGSQTPTASVTSTTGVGSPVFRWYLAATGGTALSGQTGSSLSSYPVGTTTTFYVSEVAANTCESPRTAVTVTVTAGPALTLTNTQQTVCNGAIGSVSVTSSLSDYNQYTWSPTTGLYTNAAATTAYTGGSASTVYIKNTTAGTTNYLLSALNTTTGCGNTAYDTVTIPNAYTVVTTAGRTSVCANDTTLLTLKVTGGGASTPTGYCTPTVTVSTAYFLNNFSTTGGTLNISNLNSGQSANNFGNFTATQTVAQVPGGTVSFSGAGNSTNAFGWAIWVDWNRNGTYETTERMFNTTAYSNTASGSFTVPAGATAGTTRMRVQVNYLNSNPTNPCSVAQSSGTVTNGEVEDYTFYVSPAPSAIAWSNGVSTIGTTTPYTATVSATTTYTGTATLDGCPNSGTVAVTALPLPTTPTKTDGTHCGAATPFASVTSTSGVGTPSFRWYLQASGGTAIASQTASTLNNYPISATTTFYVSEMGANGCESPRVTVTETVITAPALTLNATSQSVCSGTVTTIAVTSNTSDYDTYVWSPVDSLYSDAAATTAYTVGSNASTVYAKSTAAGTTRYTLSAQNSLTNCSNVAYDTVTIQPTFGITATAGRTTVCSGDTTLLTLTLSGSGTSGNLPTGYCVPTTSGATTYNITNFTTTGALTNINNSSSGTTMVEDFSSTVIGSALAGSTINYSIGVPGGSYGRAIWIDLNRNGVFDASEQVASSTSYLTSPLTGSFTIPAGTPAGTTRMRILASFTPSNPSNACANTGSGQYEDYALTIIPSGALTYAWSNGTTTVGTTNPYAATLNGTTTYTGTASFNGCPFSASVVVTGNPTATTPTGNDATHCGSQTPIASVTSTSGFSSPTFRWYLTQAGGTPLTGQNGSSLTNYPINTTTDFYVSEYSASGGCESPRRKITETVTAPLALSVDTRTSICYGNIRALSVTSTLSNFDTYTWTPVDSLYTDAAATVPYTAGTSASTVYLKSRKVGDNIYTLTAVNTISGCQNNVNDTVNMLPAISVSSNMPSVCISGTPTLSLGTGAAFIASGTTATIAWATSPDSITFSTVSGAVGISYTPATPITTTTYYRVTVTDQAGNTCAPTPGVGVPVYNPTVVSTTPATRCGTGTVTLSATSSAGANLNWYTAQTGGTTVFTGANYTTPVINATTTYYVAANQGGLTTNVGMPAYLGTDNYNTAGAYLIFDALAALTINTVDVFAYAATAGTSGTMTIQLQNSTGTVLQTTTVNVTGNPTAIGQTVALNFPVPIGTNHRLVYLSSTGITGAYRNYTAGTVNFPYTVPSVVSITNGSLSGYYYYFYNWNISTGCESPRTAVTATVTPAASLAVDRTAITSCNNDTAALSVSGATVNNFTSYMWTPATGLFTDAAATTPYTTGTNANVVYAKSTTAGTVNYTVTGTDASNCSNTATVAVTTLPAVAVSVTPNSLCFTGTPTATLTNGAAFSGAGATIAWSTSPDSVTFTTVSGQTGVTYTPASAVTSTTYYAATITSQAGKVCGSAGAGAVVNMPTVATTTPGTRCGTGTVTLGATAAGSATLNWYAAQTGGTALASGTSFTTPSISATTSYWVAASQGGGTANVGKTGYTGTDGTNTASAYLIFDAIAPFTLQTVDIYAGGTGAGTMTVQLQNSAGTVLQSAVVNLTGSATPVAQTVTLNFQIPVGTAYRLNYGSSTGGVTGAYRNYTAGTTNFPYTVPGVVSITNGSLSGYYYYFYNWSVTTGCESSRTQVTATVGSSPAVATTQASQPACNNGAATLSVSAATVGNYSSYVWTPTTNLYTDAAATVPYTTGTNASTVYARSNTVGSATYTVSATGNPGCANTATAAINVLPAVAVTASPAGFCGSGRPTATLTNGTTYTSAGATIAWSTSPDNITYTPVSGATGTTYTPGTPITASTYYQATITANGNACNPASALATVIPVTPVTVSATLSTICRSASDVLSVSSANSNYSYSWNTTPAQTTASITVSPTAQTQYIVTGTDGVTGCVAKDSVVVDVEQPATVTFSPSSASMSCGGSAVQLTANINTTGSITKTVWTPASFVAGTPLVGLYTDAAATTAYDSATTPAATSLYTKNSSNITYNVYVTTAVCPATTGSGAVALTVMPSTGNGLANGTGSPNLTYYSQAAGAGGETVQNADCETIATIAQSGASPITGVVRTDVYTLPQAPTIVSGKPYVPRYYQITPQQNAATATGTITLYATNAEFKEYNVAAQDSNNKIVFTDSVAYRNLMLYLLPDNDSPASVAARSANVLISKESGTSSSGLPGTFSPGVKKAIRPSSVVWNSTDNRWEVTLSTTGFSGFFIGGGGSGAGPLPVTFTGITASAEKGRNRVEWNVGSESNVVRYEVEKLSGGSFERIGFIPAAGMAQYVYYDAVPSKGLNSYRVKAIDVDGAYSYSTVASVRIADGNNFALSLFPNPTTGKVTVQTSGSIATGAVVTVSELSGRMLLQQIVTAAKAEIDLSALPSGTYMLQWSDGVNKESLRVTKH